MRTACTRMNKSSESQCCPAGTCIAPWLMHARHDGEPQAGGHTHARSSGGLGHRPLLSFRSGLPRARPCIGPLPGSGRPLHRLSRGDLGADDLRGLRPGRPGRHAGLRQRHLRLHQHPEPRRGRRSHGQGPGRGEDHPRLQGPGRRGRRDSRRPHRRGCVPRLLGARSNLQRCAGEPREWRRHARAQGQLDHAGHLEAWSVRPLPGALEERGAGGQRRLGRLRLWDLRLPARPRHRPPQRTDRQRCRDHRRATPPARPRGEPRAPEQRGGHRRHALWRRAAERPRHPDLREPDRRQQRSGARPARCHRGSGSVRHGAGDRRESSGGDLAATASPTTAPTASRW